MWKHVTCMFQVSTGLFTACFEGVEHPTAMVTPHLPCPAFSNVLSVASYAMASTSILKAKRRTTQQDHKSHVQLCIMDVLVCGYHTLHVYMIITQKRAKTAKTAKILRTSNSAPGALIQKAFDHAKCAQCVPQLTYLAASSALPGCCAKRFGAPH